MKSGKNLMKQLAILVIALLICMIPATANAAEYVNGSIQETKNNGVYILTGDGCANDSCIGFALVPIMNHERADWEVKSQRVTFSNKGTLKMYQPSPRGNTVYIGYKKPGTTKVTVTTVMKKGKKATKTVTCKFTLITKKFVTPMTSMKVGGKEYVQGIRKCSGRTVRAGGSKKLKFTYALKKGWKLDTYGNCFWVEYGYSGKTRKIKNGGIIDMALYDAQKNGVWVWGDVTDPKTGQEERIGFKILPR